MKKQANLILFYLIVIVLLIQIRVEIPNNISNNEISITISDNENIIYTNFIGCYQLEIPQSHLNQTHWFVHIPIITHNQCPIFLKNVWSSPFDIIQDFRINTNSFSGGNYLLEVNFTQIPEQGTYSLYWEISTFLKYDSSDIPPSSIVKANKSDLPNEFKPWLASTQFIQTNHSEIQLKADSLVGDKTDAISIIETIIDFTSNDIEYGVDPDNYSQDALNSLRTEKAVCTGKANLATALLRACDIPARVLMIYPTHFITECYIHPYGWFKVEPTIGQFISEPLMIPTNVYESFYLYISAYSAFPLDESSSNVIKGFSPPPAGVISYYSPVEEIINFSININNWQITCREISGSSNSVIQAFNITNLVWNEIISFNNNNSFSILKAQFPIAMNLYKEANQKISEGNLNEYIRLMNQILCKFEKGDDQCISLISFDLIAFLILSGLIFTVLYLKSYKKITLK